MMLAACDGATHDAVRVTTVPTRTLAPPTATALPDPFTPTVTLTELPAPGMLGPASTPESEPSLPPGAQAFIDTATDDLITNQDADPADVRLLGLEQLEDGYRLLFSAGSRVYIYRTDEDGAPLLDRTAAWADDVGDPVPLDPIAQSMVDQTNRDAVRRLEGAEVDLVSLILVAWPDDSLGCPQPDIDYHSDETPGYRIVFRSEDQVLIYHTSIRTFVLCSPDDELLPGIVRRVVSG